MMQDSVDYKQVLGDVQSTLANGLVDGMAELAINGTANFKQFATSVIKDIGLMIVKMTALAAIQQAVGAFKSASNPFSGVGPMKSFGNSDSGIGGSILSGIGSVFSSFFADGGVGNADQTSQQELNKGGVKKRTNVAVFAEAGLPEAFIPLQDKQNIPISLIQGANGQISAKAMLPDGNSIPAKIQQSNLSMAKQFAKGGMMHGAMKSIGDAATNLSTATSSLGYIQPANTTKIIGGDTVSIAINVSSDGKGANSSESVGNAEVWKKMSQNVKTTVLKTLAEEKRPGGMLSK